MDIQAQIPAALCSIHNFIRLHDAAEGPLPDTTGPYHDGRCTGYQEERGEVDDLNYHATGDEDVRAMRDRIAEQMWLDYQRVLRERDELGVDSDDLLDDIDDDLDENNLDDDMMDLD